MYNNIDIFSLFLQNMGIPKEDTMNWININEYKINKQQKYINLHLLYISCCICIILIIIFYLLVLDILNLKLN